MATLSHQSLANTTTPYWLSANSPIAINPLTILNQSNGTKATTIFTGANSGTYTYASYPSGANPLSMAFNQGATQPLNTITFNLGNIESSLIVRSSNAEFTKPLIISDNTNPISTFVIDPTASVISNTSGFMSLNGVFNITTLSGGATILTSGPNSNIQTPNDIKFYTSSVLNGGIAQSGTSLVIGGGSNFSTSNFGVRVDANNITSISNTLRILDPVTNSNYINFSNSAGTGYLGLVANGGVLYPQLDFASNRLTSTNTFQVGVGSSNVAITQNSVALSNGTQTVTDTLSNDNALYTTTNSITAMKINTNGIVDFPAGINISNSSLTVSNLFATGFVRSGSNVWDGWSDSNLRILNRVYAGNPPNPQLSLLGYPSIDPQTYRPDLYSNFTWFKLWFPTEWQVDTSGPINIFFNISGNQAGGVSGSISLWTCNFAPAGPANATIRNGPITYWNFPTSNVDGAGSSYGFGQLIPIMCHKSLFPIYVTGYIADPPNTQNQYRVYNGTFPSGGAGSPLSDIPFALEGWY